MFRQFYRCRAEAVRMRGGGLEFERRTVPQSGMPAPVRCPTHSDSPTRKERGGGKKGTTGNINNKGPRHVWRRIKAPRFLPANSIFSFSPACARMSCGGQSHSVNTEAA